MLYLRNKIGIYSDGQDRNRSLGKISIVVNHRLGLSVGNTPEELSSAFKDLSEYAAGSYTGGQFPYHFVGWPDGSIDQSLRLKDTGPHARRWNSSSIGIAWLGDFRKYAPTLKQVEAAIELNSVLCRYLGSQRVYGHTELPQASKDKDKECPGKFFPLTYIRKTVQELFDINACTDSIDLAHYGIQE